MLIIFLKTNAIVRFGAKTSTHRTETSTPGQELNPSPSSKATAMRREEHYQSGRNATGNLIQRNRSQCVYRFQSKQRDPGRLPSATVRALNTGSRRIRNHLKAKLQNRQGRSKSGEDSAIANEENLLKGKKLLIFSVGFSEFRVESVNDIDNIWIMSIVSTKYKKYRCSILKMLSKKTKFTSYFEHPVCNQSTLTYLFVSLKDPKTFCEYFIFSTAKNSEF